MPDLEQFPRKINELLASGGRSYKLLCQPEIEGDVAQTEVFCPVLQTPLAIHIDGVDDSVRELQVGCIREGCDYVDIYRRLGGGIVGLADWCGQRCLTIREDI